MNVVWPFTGHFWPIFTNLFLTVFDQFLVLFFKNLFSNPPTHPKIGHHLWLFSIWKLLQFSYINGLAKSLSNFYWFSTEKWIISQMSILKKKDNFWGIQRWTDAGKLVKRYSWYLWRAWSLTRSCLRRWLPQKLVKISSNFVHLTRQPSVLLDVCNVCSFES